MVRSVSEDKLYDTIEFNEFLQVGFDRKRSERDSELFPALLQHNFFMLMVMLIITTTIIATTIIATSMMATRNTCADDEQATDLMLLMSTITITKKTSPPAS